MYLFGTPRRALSLLARQQRQESFSLVQYLTGTTDAISITNELIEINQLK
jgi:hypothetical protein